MIASTDLEEADVLHTYLSRIFTNEDNTNIPSVYPIENAPKMMDIVVTEDYVLNKLIALKKSKSPGPNSCCCCCRPHSTNVLPAESSTRIMWQPTVSPPRWQGKAPFCRDSSRGPG